MKASGATAGADFARATVRAKAAARPDLPADLTLISLPGGEFLMGSDTGEGEPADGEGPARPVRLSTFRIARTAVTNRQFAAFVEATGYVTYAEEVGSSFVRGRAGAGPRGPARIGAGAESTRWSM